LKIKKGWTKSGFFQSEKVGSGKTLSELHIHCKSLLKRVYDQAGCKEHCKDFTVALTIFDIFNKKQMLYKKRKCLHKVFTLHIRYNIGVDTGVQGPMASPNF